MQNGVETCFDENGEKLPFTLVKPGYISTNLRNIGGYKEAKAEVEELINCLKHREKYRALGARLPKGVLFHGPPGNGKTLFARAMAGEGNVPFLSCSTSEILVHKEGVKHLKIVFEKAREISPCVLLFDEIDGIGPKRDMQEYEGQKPTPKQLATLEELLVQLDGFEQHPDKQILVVGATNHMQLMDAALLRPGRFDRSIAIKEPDIKERAAIFEVYCASLKIAGIKEASLFTKLAYLSKGFTGATVELTCNEAAMIAGREQAEHVSMAHFIKAVGRVRGGIGSGTVHIDDRTKRFLAYHEAGHAVFSWYHENLEPPGTVSIVAGKKGHKCSQYDSSNKGIQTNESLNDVVSVLLAGRAAEEIFMGDVTTHSAHDLSQATNKCISMIALLGFDEKFQLVTAKSVTNTEGWVTDPIGLVGFENKKLIMNACKVHMRSAYERAKRFMQEKASEVEQVVKALLESEILSCEDLKILLGERPFPSKDT